MPDPRGSLKPMPSSSPANGLSQHYLEGRGCWYLALLDAVTHNCFKYSRLWLFAVVTVYKVTARADFTNPESLPWEKTQDWVSASSWAHFQPSINITASHACFCLKTFYLKYSAILQDLQGLFGTLVLSKIHRCSNPYAMSLYCI